MVEWANVKAPQTNSKTIERLQIKAPCDHKVRLVGTVVPRFHYWVQTKEGKKATIECLGFNRESQSFDGGRDPMLEIPEGVYTDKPQFAYVCQLFHIEGETKKLKICDLKQTIYKGIVDLVVNPEYGSPDDPENGYDIWISGAKTGPLTAF